MSKPVVIDLCCGLGGWSKGFLEEGWDAIGFDIERHEYGDKRYPGELILADVLTLNGYDLAAVNPFALAASPPCQKYSYMGMPFDLGKREARWWEWQLSGTPFATDTSLNDLFNACFRIQRELSDALGREVPMVLENVKAAQRWVGSAKWHFGSYYLWGDVPALMPHALKKGKGATGSWFYGAEGRGNPREGGAYMLRSEGVKQTGMAGPLWFDNGAAKFPSRSARRKAASAMIAEIPFDLAQHIARVFKP